MTSGSPAENGGRGMSGEAAAAAGSTQAKGRRSRATEDGGEAQSIGDLVPSPLRAGAASRTAEAPAATGAAMVPMASSSPVSSSTDVLLAMLIQQQQEQKAALTQRSEEIKGKKRPSSRKEKKGKKKAKRAKKSDSSSESDSDSDSSSSEEESDQSSDSEDDEDPDGKKQAKLIANERAADKAQGEINSSSGKHGVRSEAERRWATWAFSATAKVLKKTKGNELKKARHALAFISKALRTRSVALAAFEESGEETKEKLVALHTTILADVKKFAGAKENKKLGNELLPVKEAGKAKSTRKDAASARFSPQSSKGTSWSDRLAALEAGARVSAPATAAAAVVPLPAAATAQDQTMAQMQAQINALTQAQTMPTAGRGFGFGSSSIVCHLCKQEGHVVRACPSARAFQQTQVVKKEVQSGAVQGGERDTGRGMENQQDKQAPSHRGSSAKQDLPHRWDGAAIEKKSHGRYGSSREAPTVCVVLRRQPHDKFVGAVTRVEEIKDVVTKKDVEIKDVVLEDETKENKVTKKQEPEEAKSEDVVMEEKPDEVMKTETVCQCGRCGACVEGVDLLQKEQREQLGPPRKKGAREIEEEQRRLDAMFEQEKVLDTVQQPASSHLVDDTWRMEEGEEAEERDEAQVTQEGGPQRAMTALRTVLQKHGFGKKAFDKYAVERSCYFCNRRGHTRRECMVAPAEKVAPKGHGSPTREQQRKREFVLGLLAKEAAPSIVSLWTEEDGEARMPAVLKAMKIGEEANRGNPWAESTKRRDKLRRALGYWWAIGADKTVLSWIGFGVRLKFEVEPERLAFANHRSYHTEMEHIKSEQATHVADGSFRIGKPSEVHVGNPMQVEVNDKGKRRACVDMRYTNSYLADYEFTQETLNKHVAQIVKRDMLMITTDVAKAYYQVPLHKDSQKYCAWQHDGKWVVPTVLVFGLSVAPFVFTKIMRAVLKFMRSMMIHGTNCIDDNLWAEYAGKMDEVKAVVQLVFGQLGWGFNEKCVFEASTTVLYNGMWVDSARFEIRAVHEKVDAARRLAWSLWYAARDGERVPLRDLQRLTGRLQSMKLALEGVAVWTRGIYADIAQELEAVNQKPARHHMMHLRDRALADLNFWAFRLGKQNGLPINDESTEVHLTMHTDAGDVGWGAHTDTEKVFGKLPTEVLGRSSTVRELTGLLEAANAFGTQLQGQRVRVCMDSLPAVCNLVNGGGPVLELNERVQQWWLWCRRQRVTPLYRWIPRERNTRADELSKVVATAHKLTLEVEMRIRAWLDERELPGTERRVFKRTRVVAPLFDNIIVRIEEMQRSKDSACIVVPIWRSATWQVNHLSGIGEEDTLYLGRVREVIEGEAVEEGGSLERARWGMSAYIVRARGRQGQEKGGAVR